MKINEIKNLIRKDVPIYYRRLYSGTLVFEFLGGTSESNIDFTLETKPTGMSEVIINNMDTVDYPLIPLTREIKNFITALDVSGGLPV